MKNMTKLSIIIPVYNISKYINRCLNSICKQLLDGVEIIVVDDGSLDDSILKVLIWQEKYKIIKVVSQKNKGLGGARNTGIKEAKGEYVWFVDGDDEIISNSLECVMNYVSSDDDVVVFDFERFDNVGNIIDRTNCSNRLSHVCGIEFVRHVLLTQAWRGIYRRSFLLDNSIFFREHFLHEDSEFNMRVVCVAKKMTYVNIPVYKYYTQNQGSIMNSIRIKNMEDLLCLFDTVDLLKLRYANKSSDIEYVTDLYLNIMISSLFRNSCSLSSEDFCRFKILLCNKRKRIKDVWCNTKKGLYRTILNYLQLYFPSKILYNLIYNKKIRIK